MTTQAASLVTGARQWATHYGQYPNGPQGAALTAPLRVRAGWAANDAKAIADMIIDNGSMLIGDMQLVSSDEIRSYLTEAFAGPYQGSRLTEEPREIRMLGDGAALVVTEGGFILAGQDELATTDRIRIMWVVVKRDGDWRIASYQSSPISG